MQSGLYAIVDPTATRDRDPVRVAEAILRGGCARLQLRWKDGPDGARLALARALRERCREVGVPFVMNDRADLALLSGADGLHLGRGDLDIADARRVVGSMEVGRSTHDATEAREAARVGSDLIALGPVFPTRSKDRPDPVVGLEALSEVCRGAGRPVVAIGGVTLERAAQVRAAGATFGAAIAAVCGADDPERAARELHRALRGEA